MVFKWYDDDGPLLADPSLESISALMWIVSRGNDTYWEIRSYCFILDQNTWVYGDREILSVCTIPSISPFSF
jgi:hypothetical protein